MRSKLLPQIGFPILLLLATSAGAQGPVAWFSFDILGNPGRDVAGGHDAISVVGVSQGAGVVGLAGVFASGYMQLPESADLNLLGGDFTLSLFVRTADLSNRNFFTKANPIDHRYGLGVYPTGQIGFLFFGSGLFGFALSSSTPADGSWHHVAAVKRGLIAEIWVDGVLEDTDSINPSFTDDGGFAIGRDGECCEAFNGMMDEVKIWGRALSPAEVVQEAKGCSFGPADQVIFVRSKGKPSPERRIWQSCGGTGTLVVASNASSGLVLLNGVQLLGPAAFPLSAGTAEIPISLLEGENTVEVEVRSKPGSVVALTFVADE